MKAIFKYISCYSLSNFVTTHSGCLKIQIHLMLFFIAIQAADEFFRKGIQIHLMLFFIQRKMGRRQSEWSIQIHLMLFFIRSASGSSGTAAQFKYISCYSLSEQENKIVQTWEHSNTSHVILYQILHVSSVRSR